MKFRPIYGASQGKVTEVKGLKTGDKLAVTAEKKAAEPTKEELQAKTEAPLTFADEIKEMIIPE